MQESKRRKLRGPAGRARRGAAPTKQHDDAIDLADSDSDRELLREARGGGGTAAPPRLPAPPGGRAAGSSRAAPAPQTLASLKSQMLLRQARITATLHCWGLLSQRPEQRDGDCAALDLEGRVPYRVSSPHCRAPPPPALQANELQQRIAAARQAAADSDEDDSQELGD